MGAARVSWKEDDGRARTKVDGYLLAGVSQCVKHAPAGRLVASDVWRRGVLLRGEMRRPHDLVCAV